MALSMYDASIPVFVRALRNLDRVLGKAEAFAREKGAEPDVLLQSRLVFDMLPLVRQVQIATDMATRAASRLAGEATRSVADDETTFEQLHARIATAIAHLEGFAPAQFEGAATREVVVPSRRGELRFDGRTYLFAYAIPNVFFHVTTAYNLLRENGAPIGKADFLGDS